MPRSYSLLLLFFCFSFQSTAVEDFTHPSIVRCNLYLHAAAEQLRLIESLDLSIPNADGSLTFDDLTTLSNPRLIIRAGNRFIRVKRAVNEDGNRIIEQVTLPWTGPSTVRTEKTSTIGNQPESGYAVIGTSAGYSLMAALAHTKFPGVGSTGGRAVPAIFALNTLFSRAPIKPRSITWARKAPTKGKPKGLAYLNELYASYLSLIDPNLTYLKSRKRVSPLIMKELGLLGNGDYEDLTQIDKFADNELVLYYATLERLAHHLVEDVDEETLALIQKLWTAIYIFTGEDIAKTGLMYSLNSPGVRAPHYTQWPSFGRGKLEYEVSVLGARVMNIPPDFNHFLLIPTWKQDSMKLLTQIPMRLADDMPPKTVHAFINQETEKFLAWERSKSRSQADHLVAISAKGLDYHLKRIKSRFSKKKVHVIAVPSPDGSEDLAQMLAKKIAEEQGWTLVPKLQVREGRNVQYESNDMGYWRALINNAGDYATRGSSGKAWLIHDDVVVLVGGVYRQGVAIEQSRAELLELGPQHVFLVTAGKFPTQIELD